MVQRVATRLLAVVQLVLLPLISAASIVWWLVGDAFSTQGGRDQMVRLAFAAEHAGLVGVGGVVGTAVAIVLLRRRRGSRGARHAGAAVVLAGIAGLLVGVGLRIVTARVHGANIGGGLALLFGPWLLLVLVVGATWQAVRSAPT